MKQDNIDLTVLMAVNKLDEFLDLSIRSILEQTYHYFYFFIVTNGPTVVGLQRISPKNSQMIGFILSS
jgi:GT2 family glycosyltransferase